VLAKKREAEEEIYATRLEGVSRFRRLLSLIPGKWTGSFNGPSSLSGPAEVLMPVLDGWGFLLERRKETRLREIPVVMMTDLTSVVHKARMAGVKAVLHKPFTLKELLSIVKQFSS
jgi:hypothetical protein